MGGPTRLRTYYKSALRALEALLVFFIFFLAKYGVDSMMHHQLNKLTDLTPDPAEIPLNLWELDPGSSLVKLETDQFYIK